MSLNYFLVIVHITNAYAVSSDCPNLIQFASYLGMQTKQPGIWTQLNGDYYTASGVAFVGQRVTQIDWSNRNLNGVINANALPSGLQRLDLGSNQLAGSIPNIWPSGLQLLSLSSNQLTGSISNIWPSGLRSLSLSSNQLTGSIPSTWPSGLQGLSLDSNQLTGSIPNTWPSGLRQLFLNNNYLTGDISSLPLTLIFLFLGLPGGTKLNNLTGTLVLKRPNILYINNNWITDVVVYDTSLLSGGCDLSNNPLLGNPHISNLTDCIQNGLYNASLLPYTISSSAVATTTLILKTSLLPNTSDLFSSNLDATSEVKILQNYRTVMQSATEMAISRNSFVSIVSQTTNQTTSTSITTTAAPTFALQYDCPMMVQFAAGLGLNIQQPSIYNQLESDCCTASGVTCFNNRVTQIRWSSLNLDGTIIGAYIPLSLTSLYLGSNLLTGGIPSNLPATLATLNVFGNSLSGDLPVFPNSLVSLKLGNSGFPGNHFTGSLLLNRPTQLFINDNWITDIVLQDSSALTSCDLSNNPLLGNPRLSSLTMCIKNNLYSAGTSPPTTTPATTKVLQETLATSITDASNQNTIAAANNGLTIVPVVIGVVIIFLLLSIFAVKRVQKYLQRQKDSENLKNVIYYLSRRLNQKVRL